MGGAFYIFTLLSFAIKIFDLPLRILAGKLSAFALSKFNDSVQLFMLKGQDPQIAMNVDGASYLVATECNGFGIISSCLVLSAVFGVFPLGRLYYKESRPHNPLGRARVFSQLNADSLHSGGRAHCRKGKLFFLARGLRVRVFCGGPAAGLPDFQTPRRGGARSARKNFKKLQKCHNFFLKKELNQIFSAVKTIRFFIGNFLFKQPRRK